jgi:sugar O-acyltransferase (sialic acid O-acetyltransferase NeuD family)
MVVLGAGGHAKVVVATLLAAGCEVSGVFADDWEERGDELLGVPVRGALRDALDAGARGAVVAIGDNAARKRIAEGLELPWATVVHPWACVERDVALGPGTVVFAGAVIQPGSQIGAHVIVNTGARIDHDARIGDFSHIAPGCTLAGNVELRSGVFMGAGSTVIPGVKVGAWSTVGAGAAVVAEVPAGVIAVGVPARTIGGEPVQRVGKRRVARDRA